MEPIEFEGANVVYGANQPEYKPLPAEKRENSKFGEVVTCWQLNQEELKILKRTGKIWLSCLTFNEPLQPVYLSVEQL